MQIDGALDRARSGCPSPKDVETLREFLLGESRDYDRLHAALIHYLEHAPAIDRRVVDRYIEFPDDPLLSAAVIFSAASRMGADEDFWRKTGSIAAGVPWDTGNAARVQAILALHYLPAGQIDVREIIRDNLLSDRTSVRDAAAIAAQRCFGRSELEVVAVGPNGRLVEQVGDDALNWIWPDRVGR
jgi:hypothetical protein